MSHRASITSIAKDLGISHMTVSRALNDSPNVHPDTREKVQRHAEAIGYIKSAAANTMRGQTADIVGLLLPNLLNEFYACFADELAHLCAENNLHLVIDLTDDDPAREQRSIHRLQQLRARALIAVPPPGSLNGPLPGMRLVHLVRRAANPAQYALLIDEGPALTAAVDHLVAAGHRRIGYIGGPQDLSSGRYRFAAVSAAMTRRGLPCIPDQSRFGPPDRATGHRALKDLLAIENSVTAVICGGMAISNGALEACFETGLRMPQDLAFVGFGDTSAFRWLAGGISTIQLPIKILAQNAISLILSANEPSPPAPQACFAPRASA